jgi:HEAT repeat protein
MPKRGKTPALLTMAGAAGVLTVCVAVLTPRVREEYFLYRLEHGDVAAQVRSAAILGQIRSVRALRVFMALEIQRPEFLEAARQICEHGDENVIHVAITTCARGPSSKQFSRTFKLRDAIAASLGKRGPGAATMVAKELETGDWFVRCFAADVLEAMGRDAEQALPVILRILEEENRETTRRWACPKIQLIASLEQIGPDAKAAVPTLIRVLRGDTDWSVRSGAARALKAMGPEAREAVPALLENLDVRQANLRGSVVRALGAIGEGADAAIPRLIMVLKDPDSLVRQEAAYALADIGTRREEVIAALKRVADEKKEEKYMIETARDVLRELQEAGEKPLPPDWKQKIRSRRPVVPWSQGLPKEEEDKQ